MKEAYSLKTDKKKGFIPNNNLIATFISLAICSFLLVVVWKGYARGLDHYRYMLDTFGKTEQWPAEGLIRVKALFYFYVLIIFGAFFFIRWFILADMKRKLLKSLFIFPFLSILLVYIYFKIFEGGPIISGAGISAGALALFFAEIIAIIFFIIFLTDFNRLKGEADILDKTFLVALIFHPILIFIMGSLIAYPFIIIAKNSVPKKQNTVAAQGKKTTQQDNISTWKIYRNDKNGFEFQYPASRLKPEEVLAGDMDYYSIRLSSADEKENEDAGIFSSVNVYLNIPSDSFSSASLDDYVHNNAKGFEKSFSVFIGSAPDYLWQCHDGTNVGGEKTRDCYIQHGRDIYDIFYNYIVGGKTLTRGEYDQIVKSFKFTK